MANNYGKWIKATAVTAEFSATGSAVGANGILVSGSAAGELHLTEPGSDIIPISSLSQGVPLDFSVYYISMSSGTVYVLYKNPIAHF